MDSKIWFLIVLSTVYLGCASANQRYERAIKDDNWEKMQTALNEGADVNHTGTGSIKFAIHVAIKSNDPGRVDYLLQKNLSPQHLAVGLGYAILEGKPDTVKKLIAAGASLNGALAKAATMDGDYAQMVDTLIAAGAKVSTDPDDCAELKAAIWKGREDIAIRFVQMGAQPDTYYERLKKGGKQIGGITNFCEATRRNQVQLVELMLTRKPRLDVACEGHRPLGWAKQKQSAKLIAMLTKAGAPDDNSSGKSAQEVPTEATDNNCNVTFVFSGSSAKGRGTCTLIKKVNGLYVALEVECNDKEGEKKISSKILAACAIGGKKAHFTKMGLRIPERNEYP